MLRPSPSTLLVAPGYPPFQVDAESTAWGAQVAEATAQGVGVEVLAPSPDDEEFIHLGDSGELVHRVSLARSYLLKPLRALLRRRSPSREAGFFFRAAERLAELRSLWGRQFQGAVVPVPLQKASLLPGPLALGVPVEPHLPTSTAAFFEPRPTLPPRIRSVDLVCCTYNREDDLVASLPSILGGADEGRAVGLEVEVTVIFQNEGLPERLRSMGHSALVDRCHWVPCFPAGLTRARNTGITSTRGDLLIFVDDDVRLSPGYVEEYVRAADRFPWACGVAGRILSRVEGERESRFRSVGHIRSSGLVEANFDSVCDDVPLVPMTPRGASMGFRRATVNAALGPRWFDESLTGSAHREETTVAMRLFRLGQHFVYAPHATLLHLESVTGGCENRGSFSPERRLTTYTLEYLFLHRLYAPLGPAGWLPPLLQLPKEVGRISVSGLPSPSWAERMETASLCLRAYWAGGNRCHDDAPLSLEEASSRPTGSAKKQGAQSP